MRFLTDSDYAVQLRDEIAHIIDPTTERSKLIRSEDMAIAQIKNFLGGKYDVAKIFAPVVSGADDTRDAYIVMITIDLALYHLWSKEGGNNIPKTRELRYSDALEWLKAVQYDHSANLPLITNESGETASDIRLWSRRSLSDNQY